MTPVDGREWDPAGDGLFGWADEALQCVRDVFSPSEYTPYQRAVEVSPTAVSDLTADIRLLAVITASVMILAALALLIALIAVLHNQRNQPPPPRHPGRPWLADGVHVYTASGPVAQVGYAPGYTDA